VLPATTAVFRTQYAQLQALVLNPNGGTLPGRTVTWTSENPNVVLVGLGGMALGVSAGTTRIRATADGVAGYATVEVREMPTGPIQNFGLAGTEQLRVPYIEIGGGQWTGSGGTVQSAVYVARGGTLTLNSLTQRYEQTFVVETYLTGGGPTQTPVETQVFREVGDILYHFQMGVPILRSSTGAFRYPERAAAGEYVIPQSVLGTPAQRWLWVVQ
jgi:hypothetical protein